MTRDDLIDEENRALVQRDLDTLEQKWTKVKEHKDSAQVSRYLYTRTLHEIEESLSPRVLCGRTTISEECLMLVGRRDRFYSRKFLCLKLCLKIKSIYFPNFIVLYTEGISLIRKSVRDFVRTKRFLQTFGRFLLKTKGFLPKVHEIFWE